MDLDEGKHVSITHFINPQLFWFHEISVPNEAYCEIKELEEQLQNYYKSHQPWTQAVHKPAIDMLVAVKFLSWQKMIRARVEHIANFNKNAHGGEFIMWAIDYGFPFQTKSDQIFRLPDKLSRKVDHIRRGGLVDLNPAEKDFDFRMNCAVTTMKENWSQRSCDLVEKLLNESESVMFVEKFKVKDHTWGDIIVTTHLGDKCNIRDYLIGMSLAMDAGPNFPEICLNLKVTKILPWMTNSGNSKFSANKGFLYAGSEHEAKQAQQVVSTGRDDYAKRKVEDWCARNELANFQESSDFDVDMLLDSVAFDDSASNENLNIGKKCVNKENQQKQQNLHIDLSSKSTKTTSEWSDEKLLNAVESKDNDEISEQKLGMAGALTESRKKKYGKKELPPKPSSNDFNMRFDSEKDMHKRNNELSEREKLVSSVESLVLTSTVVSGRKQKLLEKRKQISNKQPEESSITNKLHAMANDNIKQNLLIDLSSNMSATAESDNERQMDAESSSRVRRHLLNRHKETIPLAESNTDTTSSNTNELSTPQISVSSKRMEMLRKQRLEKLKADKVATCKQDGAKEEPPKEEETNTNSASTNTNEHGMSQGSFSSKRMEMLRKQRLEKLKADKAEKCKQDGAKEEPPKEEETNSDSASTNTNELGMPQSSVSSKRMEMLRKQRLEKLKADKAEKCKQECPKAEPSNLNQNNTELNNGAENNSSSTASSSSHVNRLMNLRKKVEDIKDDSFFELTESKSRYRPAAETLNENSTFHGLRMIPAGFDITNLNHYKDEKNHWHRKATTRFDYVPHDSHVRAVEQKEALRYENLHSGGQKLRGTSAANISKHASILDTTVPRLNEAPMEFSNTVKQEANNRVATTQEPQLSSSGSNLSSPVPKKYGRHRSLKSPSTQMNKIDEMLRRAYDEKAGGNDHILDLNNLNSSGCKDDSDNMELYSAEDGTYGGSTSDNEDVSAQQHSSNKRSLIKSRLQKKMTTQQAHLKQVEEQLTSELIGAKLESFHIRLPQVKELREVEGEHKLKTKFIDHLVLAHSKVPLSALASISEAFFLKEIHEEMEHMRVTKLYRIQAYAWPHLLRGNSLFIVNPHKSGKTWSYLPTICSLVAYRIQSCRLAETYGPVAIILVPTSACVEVVHNYCKRLLMGVRPEVTTVSSYGVRNANAAKIQLLNSCGILVATPGSLLRLLRDNEKESLIDIERLKHLVIDDLDLMLSRSQADIETVLKTFFKLSKRSMGKDAAQVCLPWQLVVTSRHWDSLLVALMRKASQPLLLMGDFLEAAVYGRVMISIKLCPSERKIATILEFIEQYSLENERLLVLCNSDDDVYEVVDALTTSAYVCIAYDSHSSSDVRLIVEEWRKKKVMSSRILVCADSSFPELQIQNVSHVIHYSMPTSWTKFTARFSALAQTYENYVCKNFDMLTGLDRPTARSLILLDEENSIQLPRLMDFMKKHDQLKLIHADILAVSKRVLVEREEARILQGTRMCPYVLEFGECDEPRCEFRHNLTRFDAASTKDNLPKAGDMRILILKVFSPTHYAARLLQHRSPNSTKWHDIRRSKEVCNFSIQMNLHYLKQENWNMHWPLHIGDLCVYKYADTYQRARILEMPEVQNTDMIKTIKLTVKLIDDGSIITSVKSDELYVCHDKFKDFPAQAIDIHLLGVVPFDNERTWDTKATKTVQKWIMTDLTKNECVHVSINFTLIDTIWVNNVIVMEQLAQVGQYVYRVNLKRSLLGKDIAAVADCKRQGIREIAEELGLLANGDANATISDSEMEFKSFSEHDTSNLIKFSSNDDTTESEKPPPINVKEVPKPQELIKINAGCGEDEADWDEQLRADDKNDKNSNEICLPLRSTNTPESNVATPTTTIASQMSNTDILTPTTWKEDWIALPIEQLVKVEIGSEAENGNWSDIHLQYIGDENLAKFDELLELINAHIAQLQQKPLMPFPASWFKPMQNCIVRHDNRYLRAKLYGIFNKDSSSIGATTSSIYRFFLCDYACFVMADTKDLYNDFLYPTTQQIVEFTPYQAVHCTLAGIKFNRFAKPFKVTKDYLFAYAVIERKYESMEIRGFPINSYEILLYENETEDDLQTLEMLNKALISNGVATVDEETKAFLDMHIKLPTVPKELCKFDELLQCIQRSFDLEMGELKCAESSTPLRAIELPQLPAPHEENAPQNSALNQHSTYEPLKSSTSSGSEEELLLSSTTKTSSTSNNDQSVSCPSVAHDTTSSSTSDLPPPPALQTKYKRPQVSWYDTDCLIYLVINVPDISHYYLEVKVDTLLFYAIINDQPYALVMNFLGIVEPSLVTHEIRGLNVVVRLVKGVFMKWPRLLQQSTRFPWLNFNLNAIDLSEVENLLPQQQLEMYLQKTAGLNRSDSDSSDQSDDEERNLFQTFTPIVNSEDIHDPTVELL
ncbi:uncharacterized protein LOC128857417 [Anastrepha ludens]|uniref:uncharacterized protein LOC128857417 n=1 Tax=Anastrepha ludens TaxID=28586 RepID=UPI0023B09E48|nr:uncharacterized protein LOC128857417 [Anastrepha ludens]